MSNVAFSGAVRHVFKQSKTMPPVASGRNPLVGFAMGFLFGPFGVGLYLKSFGDFFLTLALVLGGTVVSGGVAAPVLWCVCGAWAFVRIRDSNTPPTEPSADASAGTLLLDDRDRPVTSVRHEPECLNTNNS